MPLPHEVAASSTRELATRIDSVAHQVSGSSALARLCDVSESVVRKWRGGESEPTTTNLVAIARAGNVTLDWLAAGIEPKRSGETLRLDDYALVNVYDVEAAAGQGAFVNNEVTGEALALHRDWLARNIGVSPDNLAIISVRGDSMEPTLQRGDVIMVNRAATAPGEGIYVFLLDGWLFIKRLQLREGVLWAISENTTASPSFALPKFDEFPERSGVVGRVVWVGRKL